MKCAEGTGVKSMPKAARTPQICAAADADGQLATAGPSRIASRYPREADGAGARASAPAWGMPLAGRTDRIVSRLRSGSATLWNGGQEKVALVCGACMDAIGAAKFVRGTIVRIVVQKQAGPSHESCGLRS